MGDDKHLHFTMSHLAAFRLFIIWGLFESLLYIFTKGDQFKTLTFYSVVFVIITILIYLKPVMIEYL